METTEPRTSPSLRRTYPRQNWVSRSAVPARHSDSTVRRSCKPPQGREDEARLTEDIITLARHYGRYGYRKIAELLRRQWRLGGQRQAGGAHLAE